MGCRPVICQSEPVEGCGIYQHRLLRSVAFRTVQMINHCFIFFKLLLSIDFVFMILVAMRDIFSYSAGKKLTRQALSLLCALFLRALD